MKKTWSMTVGSYMVASLEQTATLMARDYKDPPPGGVLGHGKDEKWN